MSKPVTLARSLSLLDAAWIGLGSVFGTGLFVAMGLGADLVGGWVILAVLIAFVCAACNGLVSASLAADHPVAGGTYAYGRRYLTPGLGFSAGMLFLLAKSASAATGAQLVGWMLLDALNITQDGTTNRIASGAVVAVLTILVLSGAKRSARANAVIVMLTLSALIAWLGAEFGAIQSFIRTGGSSQLKVEGSGGAGGVGIFDVLTASSIVFVAYTGYGRVATLGEEVKDPARVIPRAVIITLAASMVAYLIAAALEASGAPAQNVDGPLGVFVGIGIIAAVLGSALNLVLGLSRVAFAMSRDHELPGFLSRSQTNDGQNSTEGEPTRAIIAIGIFVGMIAMVSDLNISWRLSAAAVLAYYAITNMACLKLPKAHPGRQIFRVHKVVPIIGLYLCILLGLMAGWWAVLAAGGWVIASILLRSLVRRAG